MARAKPTAEGSYEILNPTTKEVLQRAIHYFFLLQQPVGVTYYELMQGVISVEYLNEMLDTAIMIRNNGSRRVISAEPL
jgi:hypothetical protein